MTPTSSPWHSSIDVRLVPVFLARYGDRAAGLVWIGTITVVPITFTALWSEGPAPPRRLGAPSPGSASRRPCVWSSVIRYCCLVTQAEVLLIRYLEDCAEKLSAPAEFWSAVAGNPAPVLFFRRSGWPRQPQNWC